MHSAPLFEVFEDFEYRDARVITHLARAHIAKAARVAVRRTPHITRQPEVRYVPRFRSRDRVLPWAGREETSPGERAQECGSKHEGMRR